MSGDWEEYFPDLIQDRLPQPLSDHFLILLNLIQDSIQGMALRLDFGKMFGVGKDLLKLLFPGCSILLATRRLQ